MKKKSVLFSFLFLSFLVVVKAQTYEIRSVNKAGGVLAVELRVTSGTSPNASSYITDIVFGLRWLSAYNVDLNSTITTTYNIKKSDTRKLKTGYNFQAFYADFTPYNFPSNWVQNNWVEIMRLGNNLNGTSIGTFEICQPGFDITTDPNFGIDLVDYTPTINGMATCVLISLATASNNNEFFRTVSSGNWNDACTWEVSSNNIIWGTVNHSPDFNANSITIRNGHTVIVSENLSIDQTTIEAGGTMTVSAGINLNVNDGVGHDLTVSGNVNIISGAVMNIKSGSAGTASIGTSTGTVTGDVKVERFIPAKRAWRFMTVPLGNTNTIYESWQNGGVFQTGIGTLITKSGGGSGLDNGNTFSMKTFSPLTQVLDNILNTNVALSSNPAYMVFVRGDRNPNNLLPPNTNNTVLFATGQLKMGNQSIGANKKTSANVNEHTYTAIGNPYVSPIDFSTVGKTNLHDRYWVWDPKLSGSNQVGSYVLFDASDGYKPSAGGGSYTSNVGNSIIESSQAFFVESNTNSNDGTITFAEASKSSLQQNVFRTATNYEDRLNVVLKVLQADNQYTPADGITKLYGNSFSNTVSEEDAGKMNNMSENLGINKNGFILSLEKAPVIHSADTIQLKLWSTLQRDYQFEFNPEFNSGLMQLLLWDDYKQILTPINASASSSYSFNINADPASANVDRFRLILAKQQTLPESNTTIKAYIVENNIRIDWKVSNESNVHQYELEKSMDGSMFSLLGRVTPASNSNQPEQYAWTDDKPATGNNFYRIKTIEKSGGVKYSEIVNVKLNEGAGNITIYPNPVRDNKLNVKLSGLPSSNYFIRLINLEGKVVFSKTLWHKDDVGSYSFKIDKAAIKGMYNVQVSGGNKELTTQVFIE